MRSAIEERHGSADAAAARIGFRTALALGCTGAVYAAVTAVGMLQAGAEPIVDPTLAVMEILTLVAAALLVALLAAVHRWAAPERKTLSLVALAFGIIMAGLTSAVHFVGLTAGRQMGMGVLAWPSVAYAVELLAWDVFLGLALLCAAPVFEGAGRAAAARRGLGITGVLCLLGGIGPAVGDMALQRWGMVGYGLALPVACFLVAAALREPGPRSAAVERASPGFLLVAAVLVAAAVPAAPATAQQPGDTLVVPVPGTEVALVLAWIPAPEPFWMAVTEVTDDQFGPFRHRRLDADAGAGSYDADAVTRPSPPYEDPVHGMGKGDHPAGGMTRLAALRYARWLSEKTGRLFTLPTEAEWEAACLAGGPGPYGEPAAVGGERGRVDDARVDSVAWYEANSRGAFHPVGGKRANAWGLHDMHGNVAEWVLGGEPAGRGVVRGGAFDDPRDALRCDARVEEPAAWKRRDPQIPKSRWWNTDSPHVGFRLISPPGDHDLDAIRAYWAELLGR